ncbi:MAG: class II glutamine amidotransferase [Clostridium sp.]|nr:class II glutamine amidotransferase [Clostridium sp.]
MCELFAVNSKNKVKINDFLKEFYSHSVNHPHGWGLAIMDGQEVGIEKEPMQASKSHYLKERLKKSIEVKNAFAHIRYATIGNVEFKNCHPYSDEDNTGRRWTLIHNGTIFEYKPLNAYVKEQSGDTDSERILIHIINQINKAESEKNVRLSKEERFNVIDSIVCDMAKGNKLNLIIYDGELMYVHTNYANSLYYKANKDQIMFSTTKLKEGVWNPVPFTTLLAYQDGNLVLKGTNHGQEFIDNKENTQLLYRIFADL